jgi:hypothetical protein
MKLSIGAHQNRMHENCAEEQGVSRRKILGMLSAVGTGLALAPGSVAQTAGKGLQIRRNVAQNPGRTDRRNASRIGPLIGNWL